MSYYVCLSICLFVCLTDYLFDCLSICLFVYLSICLFVYLTDYQSIYQSIRPSVCLPPACLSICLLPAAAFHPYCPQWFGNNFRRKYTQSRVICQSVVVKVASHVCKSGPSAPVIPLFHCHGCRSVPSAPVGFNECCPELRQEPALLRVLRNRNSSGKASSDAGPELAGRESCVAMESPQALICPLEKGINKSSSDDRPGPGICDSKYVEDTKAARSVRVWDRVPMKNTRLGGLR